MTISIDGTVGISGMPAIFENAITSATAAGGLINFDVLTQSVLQYTTNATSNWTINFRASSTASLNSVFFAGQSITVVFLAKQGSPAFYNTTVQIDGVTVTPRWQGGAAPTLGTPNGVDLYTYAIIKTGNNAYNVYASQTIYA
jgi:hypothetical protein